MAVLFCGAIALRRMGRSLFGNVATIAVDYRQQITDSKVWLIIGSKRYICSGKELGRST